MNKGYTQQVLDTLGLDSITHQFLTLVNDYEGLPIEEMPVYEGRQMMDTLQHVYPVQHYDVHTVKKQITVLGKTLELWITTPKKKTHKKNPVLMYFHGGGWVLGNEVTYQRLRHQLTTQADMAVVFVNYSCAPEAIYPQANEEAYAATKWIATHSAVLGLDPQKIAVGGDSAGGNMATVLTLMAKERKEFDIDFQLLFYPVTDTDFNTKSYQEFGEKYYLTKKAMQWFFNQYTPDDTVQDQITVAPLRASVQALQDLPPALIITAKYDVLRTEGELYAKKMKSAGVAVTHIQYATIHDFVMLNALANSEPSIAAIAKASEYLKQIWND